MRYWRCTVTLLVACCTSELTVPDDAQIRCGADNECTREGFRCIDGICTDALASTAPTVVLAAIDRGFEQVPLSVTVVDRDSESVLLDSQAQELVDASEAPSADGWADITLSVNNVPAGSEGLSTDVEWTPGDLFEGNTRRTIVLRVRGRDSETTGPWAQSNPFVLGNAAPVAAFLPATVSRLLGSQSGAVALEFNIDDSDQDLSDVVLEYRRTEDSTWIDTDAALVGDRTDLTADGLTTHFLVWDSSNPSGGVGPVDAEISLRLRAGDDPDDDSVLLLGPEALITPVTILNFARPRFESVTAPRSEVSSGQAPIAIVYTVSDAAGVPVDVEFEFSDNARESFVPCQEYVGVRSEGRSRLETSAAGVEHTFVWDPSEAFSEPENVILRLTVAQSDFPDSRSSIELPLLETVGPVADGVLTETQSLALTIAGQTSHGLETGDFNEDGYPDLVAFLRTTDPPRDGKLVLFFGSASGFSESATVLARGDFSAFINTRPGDNFVAVGDVDSDTHLDILAIGDPAAALNGFSVYYGTGTGSFSAPTTVTTGTQCYRIVSGPFISGNDFDFLVSCVGLSIYQHTGARNLGLAQSVTPIVNSNRALVSGDFNGDGNLDFSTPWPEVYLGDGTGDFSLAIEGPLRELRSLAAIDLEGDGTDEIIIGDRTTSSTYVYRFAERSLNQLYRFRTSGATSRIAVGDLNGDDLLDFVDGRGRTAVFRRGNGAQATNFVAFRESAASDLPFVQIVDSDLDGRNELIVMDDTGNLSVFDVEPRAGVVGENFSPPLASNLAEAQSATDFALADVDRDGNLDLIAGALGVLHGDENGRFGDERPLGNPDDRLLPPVRRPVVIDLNGDGLSEVVDATFGEGRVLVLDTSTFRDWNEQSVTLGIAVTTQDAVAGDFDGDGIADVAVAFINPPRVLVSLGTGDLAAPFESPIETVLTTATNASYRVASLDTGDLNLDGHVDIFIAGPDPARILWCPGDGTGGFDTSACVSAVECFSDGNDLVVEDLNADGLLDVYRAAGTCVYLADEDSDGGFAGSFTFAGPAGSGGAVAGLQLEGPTFTVAASEVELRVDDLGTLGRPSGTPAGANLEVSIPGGGFLTDLDARDLNRDGQPDLVALDATGRALVFLGQDARFGPGYQALPVLTTTIGAEPFAFVNIALPSTGLFEDEAVRRNFIVRTALQPAGPASFFRQLMVSDVWPSVPVTPLHGVYELGGFVKLARVSDPRSTTGRRLRRVLRFGAADATAGQGVVVTLPTFPDVDFAMVQGATVRVFRRTRDWLKADGMPNDPDRDRFTEGEFLPRVADGLGFRDYIQPIYSWDEIPRAVGDDLSTGAGERFSVEQNAGGETVLRLFVDRDGWVQAFIED
ncbi:MAG: VCBS repeat-containing protein [Myxococcota bacterium]